MVPLIDGVDACVHAMLSVPSENDRGHHRYGYEKGEDKCLTYNMSCIRLVGDVDDVGVAGAVVAGVGLEAVRHMEEGSRH
jgi:hypothetical protein